MRTRVWALLLIIPLALAACGGEEDMGATSGDQPSISKKEAASWQWDPCSYFWREAQVVDNCYWANDAGKLGFCQANVCTPDRCPDTGTCGTGGYYQDTALYAYCVDAWTINCLCRCDVLHYVP